MRVLILNSDYLEFLDSLYSREPSPARNTFSEQMTRRWQTRFGVFDIFSRHLKQLGHEACDVIVNNEPAQKAWAREHSLHINGEGIRIQLARYKGWAPWFSIRRGQSWIAKILAAQIEDYRPDVILNLDMEDVSGFQLRDLRRHYKLLVGYHAAHPIYHPEYLCCYDLCLSSFKPKVEEFRRRGVRAELLRLAFDPIVLESLGPGGRQYDVSFIGSFGRGVHAPRIALLERICREIPQTRVWGPGCDHLPWRSPLRRCYAGPAWGMEMYQILRQSRLTINHHGDVAPSANNMRLFEATGVQTLLLTDWKPDLHELFEPEAEVATYRDVDECIVKIRRLLANQEAAEKIALAGHSRTLREHSYEQRMRTLLDILSRAA